MSTLGASIKYSVIAVAIGYFFYQLSPSSQQVNLHIDVKERQKVLDVMRKAARLDLPDTPSNKEK